MIRCSICGNLKAPDQFYGKRKECKHCYNTKRKKVYRVDYPVSVTEKECMTCRCIKPAAEFYPKPTVIDGLDGICKDCKTNARLLRVYGITLDTYNEMWLEQGGVCKICGESETAVHPKTGAIKGLAVDHNHATGRVRFLCCSMCNLALGNFRDNPDLMRKGADYIDMCNEMEEA